MKIEQNSITQQTFCCLGTTLLMATKMQNEEMYNYSSYESFKALANLILEAPL